MEKLKDFEQQRIHLKKNIATNTDIDVKGNIHIVGKGVVDGCVGNLKMYSTTPRYNK
jgi:hypothetical protein